MKKIQLELDENELYLIVEMLYKSDREFDNDQYEIFEKLRELNNSLCDSDDVKFL